MLPPLLNQLLIPCLMAIFLAINMGASGTAPSFSAAYGSKILRQNFIPGLFGFMVFLGALVAGKATATTVGETLLPPEIMGYKLVSIILFSISIALLLSNLLGIPQSTSQATVMAIAGPAMYFGVFDTHKMLYEIIPTWFITPIIAFVLCFLIGKYIYNPIRRRGLFTYTQIYKHPVTKGLVILMSMYVAFSIGSNNVANASGPIASMLLNELNIAHTDANFNLILMLSMLIVAPSFAIGSSLMGRKVLNSTGRQIILFGPIEAIIISFITASILLLASVTKGIPTSLVQLNVGAILGIAVAKLGVKNILKKTAVNKFFIVWITSPLIAFGLSLLLTFIFVRSGWM